MMTMASSIINPTDTFKPNQQIAGIYDPYYTPEKQYSNSLLANLFIIPTKTINIKLHASVGFYSRAMNPYYYGYKDQQKQLIIIRDFYEESFTPMDIGFDFNADLSDKLMLNLSYQYLQTFYFDSNNFNIGLKIYF